VFMNVTDIGSGFRPSCMAEVGFASGPRELQFVGKYGLRFWPQKSLGTYTLRCLRSYTQRSNF